MTYITFVGPIYYNAIQYGATGNGSTDDTTAVQAAIAAANVTGGVVFFPAGTYKISSPLSLSTANVLLKGAGQGASSIIAAAGFSGSQMILCSANNTGVLDLGITGGPSTTYSSNPSATGIQVTGAVGVQIENVFIQYVNGWGVQSTSTAGQANYNLYCSNVHVYSSAQGFHTLGVSGSGNEGVQHLIGCNADTIQNGDCYLFEDVYDVLCSNILGSCTAGSGNSVHIKGKCAAIMLENVDLGPNPGPSTGAVVLVESGANGTPNMCGINGGIVEGGSTGISVTAGTLVSFTDLKIYNNGTYGVNLTGGDNLIFEGCEFSANGSSGSSGRYDFQSTSTGHVLIEDCIFATPQGTTAGHTNNAINISAGTHTMQNNTFTGSGYNSSNICNGYPAYIRNNTGFNPLGAITAPVIGASPFTPSLQSFDYTVFVTGGTVSSIKIGGTVTGLTSGTFRVPAQQSITLTYTVAPTWTWFGD